MHSPIERNVPQHKMNTKKTKARSSCFLSHLAWKRERAYFYFGTSVTYLLRHLPTYSPGTHTGHLANRYSCLISVIQSVR